MTPALSLESLTDDALFRHVSDALKQFHSVLLLARSPLADSQLVVPALVRDDLSPTAQERGQALRLVLRWAVEQLPPTAPRVPLGAFRPLDDPTWQDPAWWRYNILRHRYLEPLHPDEFVEGGRYTETLLALTGIPTRDLFYEERARAVREVGQWLRTQATDGEATHMLRQRALEEVYAAVRDDRDAHHLLAAAATFNDVIPQPLLAALTQTEGVREPVAVIDRLVAARYLLAGDGATLWLSPVLRRFLYARETPERRRVRHHRIGAYYRDQGDTLRAVYHLQQAQDDSAAAALLLDDARDLLYEADGDELAATLARFDRAALGPEPWYRLQTLLADVYRTLSRHEQAVAACRSALQAAPGPLAQARIYHRLGKLYEQRSQRQALDYYAQAAARLEDGADDEELVELLKDRAWVQIERGDFAAAQADLEHAQARAPQASRAVQADIHDALASLHYYQGETDAALHHMRAALSLREESGDLLGVAKSQTNLGLLFSAQDDHTAAVAVYKEALSTYQRLGNRELAAATLLNLGMAHHLMGERPQAILYYRETLALCHGNNWHVTAARAHSNLAEAHAELADVAAAQGEWQAGITLARDAGLDDEVAYFVQLLEQFPLLQATEDEAESHRDASAGGTGAEDVSQDFESRQALQLARTAGRVTARELMDAAGVSKATATRKLAALAERGALVKVGQGRNTQYVIPGTQDAAAPAPTNVRELLRQQRVLLEHYYGVAELALMTPAEGAGWLELAATFVDLPDLPTFFELEARLERALARAVRLRPTAVLGDAETDALTQAEWLWRAA